MSASSAVSYPARSLVRLSTMTIFAAASASTSSQVTAISFQPSRLAAFSVWLPARTSFGRPVSEPLLTTIGRYWPFVDSDSAIASRSPVRGLRW